MKLPLFAIAFGCLLSTAAMTSIRPISVSAEGEVYSFALEADLHHCRFPDTDGGNFGNERNGAGINWTDGSQGFLPLESLNSSFLRLVINAEQAATYSIPITFSAGQYPIRAYINSSENYVDFLDISGTWTPQNYNMELPLEAGGNVVALVFSQWGSLRTFTLPEGLSLPERSVEGEKLLYQAAYLEGVGEPDFFDPEFAVSYGPLAYDTDAQFEGAAISYITPSEGYPSLDVTIEIEAKSAQGEAKLGYAVGSANAVNPSIIDLSSFPVGEEVVVHLPSYALANMGYAEGSENYVRLTNELSGTSFKVKSVATSRQVDEDPYGDMKTIDAETLKTMVDIRGRSLDVEGEIPIDWSASGIGFLLEGKGDVIAKLNITSNTQNTEFTILIDGQIHKVKAASEMVLATDLEQGIHHIEIYKSSEAAGNLMSLLSLDVDQDAVISKPEKKALKFEFIGDSITCANQVAAGVEDAYQGFARRLSSAYDADFDVISVSGRGLMEGYNSESGWAASQQAQMKDIWDYESYFRNPSISRVDSEQPDAVFVGLGSNDLGVDIMNVFGTTIDEFTTEAVSFASKLRLAYPEAKIIFAYGSFINRNYIEEYRAAIEGIEDEGISFVEFPQMMLGDSGHMNELNHDEAASILSKRLSSMLGVEDPYIREYLYTTYEAEDGYIDGATAKPLDPGTFWSGEGYVGDFKSKPDKPENVEGIKDDLSNISYVRIEIYAPESASYDIRVGLATSTTATYAYKVDDGEWKAMSYTGSDWAGGHGVYQLIEDAPLAQGKHQIYLTEALNDGGWLNYDYIALLQGESLPTHSLSVSPGTGYEVIGLPEKAIDGESASFSIRLEDEYSKSNIEVYANDVLLTKQSDGTYLIPSVDEDILIRVEGVVPNRWKANFYVLEGDAEPFESIEIEVGGEISVPETEPTREGYIFKGWDITFPNMPNSDINVYAKWEAASPEAGNEGKGPNIGLIVGASIGGVAAAAIIAGVAFYLIKRKKAK